MVWQGDPAGLIPYTPVWTATTTNPTNYDAQGGFTIDGMVSGYAWVRGKTASPGPAFTAGSGGYSISLPVAASSAIPFQECEVILFDNSASGSAPYFVGFGKIDPGATTAILLCESTTSGNAWRSVTTTAPFTWTVSDWAYLKFNYWPDS